jgi:hypothetical protein
VTNNACPRGRKIDSQTKNYGFDKLKRSYQGWLIRAWGLRRLLFDAGFDAENHAFNAMVMVA